VKAPTSYKGHAFKLVDGEGLYVVDDGGRHLHESPFSSYSQAEFWIDAGLKAGFLPDKTPKSRLWKLISSILK